MLECIILGDSIAVGTQMFYKECQLMGKGGINSWQFNQMYPVLIETSKLAIISLGTNDHIGVNTKNELTKVRNKIKSEKVFWILPYNNSPLSGISIKQIQKIVKDIATQYNDVIIEIKSLQHDKIHPSWKGYEQIVREVKEH